MAGKLMRYPADIIDASTDYFKIEILKNIKEGGGFGSISALSSGSRASQISLSLIHISEPTRPY